MNPPQEDDLTQKYPNIQKARLCANQQNYSMASDLYSEVLNELSSAYPQDDINVCRIYIDYANSLICNCEKYFTEEYLNIVNHHTIVSHQRKSIEDDLEIAWNVLEIAKVVLQKDKLASIKIRFLLGEILLLNNHFNEAICEYTESMALSERQGTKYCECLLKIASCHEFMKNYAEANVSLKKITEIYEESKGEIEDERVVELLADLKERIEFNETKYSSK